MKIVIVGGGIAGTTAAEEIRKRDANADISIIEGEQHRLYSRVLLPHYVEGRVERDRVFLKKPEWYTEKNIELFLGVRVEKIDTTNKFVLTSEGRELPYDMLLITTGGDLRLLEDDKRGVSYLRSLDDADHLIQLINEVKTLPEKERHAAVYGGGFIALEYLNIFQKHKIQTTLIMRSPGFWSRILSEHSQHVMRTYIESQGVRVLTNETIELLGDEVLMDVKCTSGEVIPASILGIGIGNVVDFPLLKEAGIEVAQGVVSNEFLETSVENVYTAGDIAEFTDTVVDRRVKLGNWMNALMQARVVAKNMLGERIPFELVSSYATDFLGMDAVFIGDVSREHADDVRQLVAEEGVSVEVFQRNGRTVGAVLLGDVTGRQKITNAIKNNELVSSYA